MRSTITAIFFALPFFLSAQKSSMELHAKADSIRLLEETVKLYDLAFSDAEADSMLDDVNFNIQLYKSLHQTLPKNDIPYPFAFSPVPFGVKIPSKKIKLN